jgi:hypothetical protein
VLENEPNAIDNRIENTKCISQTRSVKVIVSLWIYARDYTHGIQWKDGDPARVVGEELGVTPGEAPVEAYAFCPGS